MHWYNNSKWWRPFQLWVKIVMVNDWLFWCLNFVNWLIEILVWWHLRTSIDAPPVLILYCLWFRGFHRFLHRSFHIVLGFFEFFLLLYRCRSFISLTFLVEKWKIKKNQKKNNFGVWYAQMSSVGIERRRAVWPFTNFPSKDQVWAASGTGSYILFDVNGVERVLIWRSDW